MPFGGEQLAGLDGELHLGAGADQDTSGVPPSASSEHVAALGDVLGAAARSPSVAAREGREVLPGQDQPGRAVGVLQDRLPAAAVSLASAGRTTSRPGIARSAARCSIGWWVGPSSPRPMESWVQT